jgi:hypothetical protein
MDDQGIGFRSRQRQDILLFFTERLWGTPSFIQWVEGGVSPSVKWPECEADHLSSSGAEAKNAWSCTFSPSQFFKAWCYIKNGVNLSFSFTTTIIKNTLYISYIGLYTTSFSFFVSSFVSFFFLSSVLSFLRFSLFFLASFYFSFLVFICFYSFYVPLLLLFHPFVLPSFHRKKQTSIPRI